MREQRTELDELRAELNGQHAELKELRLQAKRLLCERMPDQCLAAAASESSP